ncbi:MAG: lycopene cyclase domain-containing protein [Bacteroidales bacterium]
MPADRRLKFYREWKYFLPAMFITLVFFIAWDVLYTHWGIWEFNDRHLTGIKILNLFLWKVAVFCNDSVCLRVHLPCTQIYLLKKDILAPFAGTISWILILVLVITGAVFYLIIFTPVLPSG